MSNMTAYPGRTFGQLYHRFVKGNALATGSMEIGDRTIDLAAISVPTLVFAGNTDGIAPLPAVRAVVPLLTGSPQVRFEVVPGGHLGMLTGRAARSTTGPPDRRTSGADGVVARGPQPGTEPGSGVPRPRSARTRRAATASASIPRAGSDDEHVGRPHRA